MGTANQSSSGRRSIPTVILGLLLLGGGIWALSQKVTPDLYTSSPGNSYHYDIRQSMQQDVSYLSSSFYTERPGMQNTAFVSELTDKLDVTHEYEFSGSEPTELRLQYDATAKVQANYATKGNSEEMSSVWAKEYLLTKPTTETFSGSDIKKRLSVTIPYSEYRKVANDFRTALSLPTSSEVIVTITYRLSGTAHGAPFTDTRVSTLSAPLDQQIYVPAVKYEKENKKDILAPSAKRSIERLTIVQIVAAALAALAGSGLVIFGLRKRIFKSSYHRELDKIYRYHDGIIVRTKHPVDVSDSKIVPMRSFDDMLNLEEELKTPIVANEVSTSSTEFMIVNGGVVYRYTISDDSENRARAVSGLTREVLKRPAEHATKHSHDPSSREPARRVRRSIPVHEPSIEDIVKELDKKTITVKKK